MKRFEKENYFEIINNLDIDIPFAQSIAWYNYMNSRKEKIVFYIDDETNVSLAFWGRIKNVPILSKRILIIDSPIIHPRLNEKIIKELFSKLISDGFCGIEIKSNVEYNVEQEVGLRRAGFVRPFVLSICPLTIEIQLGENLSFPKQWRKNVRNARSYNLKTNEITLPTIKDAVNFCDLFLQTKNKKELKYSIDSSRVFILMSSPNVRTFVTKNVDDEVLSSNIVYTNNKYSYSSYRVNSNKAREVNASYLLINDICEILSREGFTKFDFGQIPPSNNSSDSVYIFKNASRGLKIQYNGEWVFYKSKWIEYLMFVYKQLILKKQRY